MNSTSSKKGILKIAYDNSVFWMEMLITNVCVIMKIAPTWNLSNHENHDNSCLVRSQLGSDFVK